MEWESPWGLGFPGWHIECSAMSAKYLGQPFDVHTGGADLAHIHHPNEIAQSEAAYGKPLANYWLHGEFMSIDGEKMSKSLGNTYSVQDVIDRGYNPIAFRLLSLMTHYRKPLNFTWESLKSADLALKKLQLISKSLPSYDSTKTQVPDKIESQFISLISRDLAIPQALALFWNVLKSDEDLQVKSGAVSRWDEVFGLGLKEVLGEGIEIPKEVSDLVIRRETSRKDKDFKESDRLREQILDLGFEVRDSAEGAKIVPVIGPTLL